MKYFRLNNLQTTVLYLDNATKSNWLPGDITTNYCCIFTMFCCYMQRYNNQNKLIYSNI